MVENMVDGRQKAPLSNTLYEVIKGKLIFH